MHAFFIFTLYLFRPLLFCLLIHKMPGQACVSAYLKTTNPNYIPMKKSLLIILSFTILSVYTVNGQSSRVDTIKPASSVYFELLGNGGFYSINYDSRFSKKRDGLGGRVGLSYAAESGDSFFSMPVGINYLAGKKGHYFEAGAGITYYSANIYLLDNVGDSENGENTTGVFGNLTFGYRKQPIDGGFSLRAGVSPIITKNSFIPYWPYVSFGYTF